jgi:hypothetical protein
MIGIPAGPWVTTENNIAFGYYRHNYPYFRGGFTFYYEQEKLKQ